MSYNSNKKKSATLGMPHGTAVNQLRKKILFHLLKKLNEDICFACDKKIETVDELSIEHIKPWEGISAELFWDLDNIAFSHLKCNVTHTRHGGKLLRKIGPEGTSWCVNCQQFLPQQNFHKNSSRWTGLHMHCKNCWNTMRKEHRKSVNSIARVPVLQAGS